MLSSWMVAACLLIAFCAPVFAQDESEPAPATSGSSSATAQNESAEKDEAPAMNESHMLKERRVRLIYDENNVVRSGPGNTYAIVGVFPAHSEFPVIAKKGEWYNIRLSDTSAGWVHSSLCDVFDDMSDLEFRPNPRLFSRVGSFAFTPYAGGYSFDRMSNSLVLGGRLGYYLLEWIEVEGSLSWTRVTRPAEIVESLFNLVLEEEDFHMLFYSMNLNLRLLPGRQMVPYLTAGVGSSIAEGETESSINYGGGITVFVSKHIAMRWEVRNYRFQSGSAGARRTNNNYEFSLGTSILF